MRIEQLNHFLITTAPAPTKRIYRLSDLFLDRAPRGLAGRGHLRGRGGYVRHNQPRLR